jgi:DNA-binding NarL/FixJ family response regulator
MSRQERILFALACMPKPHKTQKKKISRTTGAKRKRTFHGNRVVIVDDHPLIRRGIERMLHSTDGFTVCGEAGNAADAFKVIKNERPDLAIVDVGLPDKDGIELTRTLVNEFPRLAILILSMHEEPLYAMRALKAGARGYMVKHDAVEKIHVALKDVLAGRRYLSPAMAAQMRNGTA